MKTTILISLFIGSWLWLTTEAWAVKPLPDEIAQSKSWVASVLGEAAAKEGRLPFSFVYDGRPATELLKGWTFQRSVKSLDPSRTEHTLAWTDPKTALAVRCVAVEYLDLPAVEWTLYFKNGGAADTPILENVLPLDASLDAAGDGECRLDYAEGSHERITDFRPMTKVLSANDRISLASFGGRSSDGFLPFFNLALPGSGGVITAIGWTGQWAAEFGRDATNGLRVRGGQEALNVSLHPGEEIRSPLIVLQFWSGRDWIDAQNIWRRWMIRHNLPRPGGKELAPALFACSSHQFNEMINANEANQIQFIDRYLDEGLKIDYWWMDTGWYPCSSNWAKVGTWEVDLQRFPHGLKAINDHARSRGVKTLVWFEPERVAQDTWLMTNHAGWVIPTPSSGGATHNLLNFGSPEAERWMTNHVDKLITEQQIDLYREDSNIDPLRFWRSLDAPNRQGMTEIGHVTGHLAYWDELARRHPEMPIDACASGGRRNDLETMRRAASRTRSDYLIEPIGEQCHTYGIALWLPYYGTGFMDVTSARDHLTDFEKLWNALSQAESMTPGVEGQSIMTSGRDRFGEKAFGLDDRYPFRSAMCPSMTHCLDVRRKDLDYDLLRRLFAQWRRLSPYLLADYYPLSPYSTGTDVWMVWQFNRPEVGDGMVQAFRRHNSPYETSRYHLRGLDPKEDYALSDVDNGKSRQYTGRELMEEGLVVQIPDKPSAVILTYTKVENRSTKP